MFRVTFSVPLALLCLVVSGPALAQDRSSDSPSGHPEPHPRLDPPTPPAQAPVETETQPTDEPPVNGSPEAPPRTDGQTLDPPEQRPASEEPPTIADEPPTSTAPAETPTAVEEDDYDLDDDEALIQLRAMQPNTTVYVVEDGAEWLALGGVPFEAYEELCRAPCEAVLDRGPQVFAASVNGSPPLGLTPVVIHGEQTLRVQRIDHSAVRIAGWTVLLAGLALSGALIGVAAGSNDSGVALAAGAFSGVLAWDATMGGLIMGSLNDQTIVHAD